MRGRTVHAFLAHMPGVCALATSNQGDFLLSSGPDSTLRAHDIRDLSDTPSTSPPVSPLTTWWQQDPPTEPELPAMSVADLHDKPVDAIALSPTNTVFATACDDGFVRIFSISAVEKPANPCPALTVDAQLLQSCARFAAPVNTLAFSPTGAYLAAAGDEPGLLKLIMTAQPTNVTILRVPKDHPACEAFRALFYDPQSDYIVAITENGNAIVWDVDKCVMLGNVHLNGRKAISAAWSPDGGCIVFATDKGIVFVSRNKWQFDFLLEDANEDEDEDMLTMPTSSETASSVAAVSWSPNGRYLLAARQNFTVSLWHVDDRKVLAKWKTDDVPQILAWHPKSNAFMFIDNIGQWAIIPNVVPTHMPSPFGNATNVQLPTLPDQVSVAKNTKKPKAKHHDDDDDDDEAATIKRSRAKHVRKKEAHKKSKRTSTSAHKSGTKEALIEADKQHENPQLENPISYNASDLDADDEEETNANEEGNGHSTDTSGDSDDDSASDEEIPGEFADLENGGVQLPQGRKKKSRKTSSGSQLSSRHMIHTPFMPASTPLSEKAKRGRHILTWNVVGAVLSYDEKTHDIVEIEFAEINKRNIGIKDHFGYTMASISDWGVLLASNKKKEHGALFTFRPFSTWSHNSDWTQVLHPEDDICAVALGKRFCAVATTPNNLVRIFSLPGLQTNTFGIPGTIITLAALDRKLVVVYAEPLSAALKCEIIEININAEVEASVYIGDLMVGANSSLEWVGFARDTLELCSYDSNGWLWMLTDMKVSKRWVPMMQNAAQYGECDWFWVAAVTSSNLIGVPCLSNERFPAAKPRPALRSLPLWSPVIERPTGGKAPTIERLMRKKLEVQRAVNEKRELEKEYDSDDSAIEEVEEKISRMEVETDKCLLALMEDACKRERNMRALDLTTRLNCEISFKYAVELARHYKRTALVERVEQVAAKKMELLSAMKKSGRKAQAVKESDERSRRKEEQAGDSGQKVESDVEVVEEEEEVVVNAKKKKIGKGVGKKSTTRSTVESKKKVVVEAKQKKEQKSISEAAQALMEVTDDEEENESGKEEKADAGADGDGDADANVTEINVSDQGKDEKPTEGAKEDVGDVKGDTKGIVERSPSTVLKTTSTRKKGGKKKAVVEIIKKRKTRKRSKGTVAASQASMGGATNAETRSAKKARTGGSDGKGKGKTETKSAKGFFRNRFLKK